MALASETALLRMGHSLYLSIPIITAYCLPTSKAGFPVTCLATMERPRLCENAKNGKAKTNKINKNRLRIVPIPRLKRILTSSF